ncbi:MAG: hypothetical protein JWM37_157 [Candidatus Saccharibacteria bacterium]|nr:hypothetical protein [Candidatus Saccharibacteria bacterium]
MTYPVPEDEERLHPETVALIGRSLEHLALIDAQPLTLERSPFDQYEDSPLAGRTIVGQVTENSHSDGGHSRFMWFDERADRITTGYLPGLKQTPHLRGQVDFQRLADDGALFGSIQYYDLGNGKASVEVQASASSGRSPEDEGFAMNAFAIVFGMQRIWQAAYEKRGRNLAINYDGPASVPICRNIALGLQLATENPQKLH